MRSNKAEVEEDIQLIEHPKATHYVPPVQHFEKPVQHIKEASPPVHREPEVIHYVEPVREYVHHVEQPNTRIVYGEPRYTTVNTTLRESRVAHPEQVRTHVDT